MNRRLLRWAVALSPLLILLAQACAVSDVPFTRFTQPEGGAGGEPSYDGGTGCTGSGAVGNGATGSGATGSGAVGNGASGSMSCGSGATTGSGGSAGTPDAGPPQCDDSLKRCQHTFTYPDGGETSVQVRGDFATDGWTTGVPMTKQGSEWTANVQVPYNTDVQYKFFVNGTTWVTDPDNPNTVSDGEGGENSVLQAVTCSDWTCQPPPTLGYDWRDAILYFVFVDRFKDGDPSNNGTPIAGVPNATQYQGGDWAGVIDEIKAGYFKSLGVNALWLTVPADNTSAAGIGSDGHEYSGYHGYWPSHLDQPEEHFGTMAELKTLVDDAHAAGLHVILDYAMNQVYQDSPTYLAHENDGWFNPIQQNGETCVCNNINNDPCNYDGSLGKSCWFAPYLPDFNFNTQAARDFSVNNAIWWLQQTGADGMRLDAVKQIEDSWITELRSEVTSQIEPVTKQHVYLVGETFSGDRNEIKYYVNPGMLDGQFDFPLRAELISTLLIRNAPLTDLDSFLSTNDGFYGSGIMSTFIGNHDVPRSIEFGLDTPLWTDPWTDGKDRNWQNQPTTPSNANPYQRLGNAFTLLFTLRGIPLIYYGDEIGMPGAGDPDNRRMMQWSGYSQAQLALRDHISKLATIRAAHPALRDGVRSTLSVTADTYAYQMDYNGDTVYVAINRSDSAQSVGGLPSAALQDLLTGSTVNGPTLSVPARSSMVLTAK
jgi:glycosidase